MNTATAQEFDYKVVTQAVNKEGSRFVFFAGNTISPQTISRNNAVRRGGTFRHIQTLSHVGGYIPRCEITELRQYMHSEPISCVAPGERKHWIPSYQIPKGINEVTGLPEMQVIGVTPTGEHDGLLRQPVYPVDDVAYVAYQSDGVVEMPCRNVRERNEAQNFLFPQGQPAQFPTMEKLKQYFEERKNEANGNEFFELVADAAIKSCEDFISTAETTMRDTKELHTSYRTKGQPWAIPHDAQAVYATMGAATPDEIAKANDSKFDKMADAMTKVAEVTAGNATARGNNAMSPDEIEVRRMEAENRRAELELEREKIAIERARLGLGKEGAAKPPEAQHSPETAGVKTETVFNVGDKVIYEGKQTEIVRKQFGKYVISIDGENKQVEGDVLTRDAD